MGRGHLWSSALLVAFATSLVPDWGSAQGQPGRRPPPRQGIIQGSEFVIVATDSGLEAPDQVDAGLVNLRLFNRTRGLHHIVLFKVERLDRISAITDLLRSNDWNVPWIKPLGGPERVGPGSVSSAILIVDPGRYVVADLGDGTAAGRQNLSEASVRELSIVRPLGPDRLATLPPTELTITLTEWSVALNGPLRAGRRTVRIENAGQLEHHLWIVRMMPGHTMQDVLRWTERGNSTMPFEPVGGTTVMDSHRSVNVTLDLLPGEYTLICALFNPLSRRTHAQHGMVKQVTVTH
jgi:hypothetical protein